MQSPDSIDRVAPTVAPDQPVVMYQNWHHLLFLHWEVPPADLQSALPAGLDLDTFEGHAYVGLVPFTISGARPVLMPPMPGVASFHEVNVRTYVHCRGKDPGVWFFSLDASSSIAVAAARAAYKLPYFHADIDLAVSAEPLPAIHFQSRRDDSRGPMPASCDISWRVEEGAVKTAALGTLDYFLLERYLLYTVDERRDLHRARIHHQPYPMQGITVTHLDDTLVWASGVRAGGQPQLRHYASEVNVAIYPLEKVRL